MKSHTLALCLITLARLLPDATEGADVRELLRETQKTSADTRAPSIVWWLPTEFWRTSLAEDPSITPDCFPNSKRPSIRT